MAKLDDTVIEHVNKRLLEPSRLALLLSGIAERRHADAASVCTRIQALQAQVTDAADRLRRLYSLVEEEAVEIDDVLRDRLAGLRAEKAQSQAALERAQAQASPVVAIDPALVEAFGTTMQASLVLSGKSRSCQFERDREISIAFKASLEWLRRLA